MSQVNFNIGYTGQIDLSLVAKLDDEYAYSVGSFYVPGGKLEAFKARAGTCTEKCVTDVFSIYKGDNAAIFVSGCGSVIFFANSLQLLETVVKKFEKFFKRDVTVDFFFHAKGSIETSLIVVANDELGTVIPELYADIDSVKLLDAFGASASTTMILLGDPGVGKTSFIRLMLKSGRYSRVAYIKGSEIAANQQTWAKLARTQYDLVIFDDMDTELDGRTPFVSNLLSFSDGIFCKSSKMLITTNQNTTDIDEALMRPGRCFDVLKLHNLSQTKAFNVWETSLGLDGDDLKRLLKEAGLPSVVSQAQLMAWYEQIVSGTDRSYVRDSSASYALSGLGLNEKLI
jgi:hypothetical protein